MWLRDAALLASLNELVDAVHDGGPPRAEAPESGPRVALELGRLVGRRLAGSTETPPAVGLERVSTLLQRLGAGSVRATPWDLGVTRVVVDDSRPPPSRLGEWDWCLFVSGLLAGATGPEAPHQVVVDHDRCRSLGDERCEFVVAA